MYCFVFVKLRILTSNEVEGAEPQRVIVASIASCLGSLSSIADWESALIPLLEHSTEREKMKKHFHHKSIYALSQARQVKFPIFP